MAGRLSKITHVVGKLAAGEEGLSTENEEEQKKEINNRLKRGDLWVSKGQRVKKEVGKRDAPHNLGYYLKLVY